MNRWKMSCAILAVVGVAVFWAVNAAAQAPGWDGESLSQFLSTSLIGVANSNADGENLFLTAPWQASNVTIVGTPSPTTVSGSTFCEGAIKYRTVQYVKGNPTARPWTQSGNAPPMSEDVYQCDHSTATGSYDGYGYWCYGWIYSYFSVLMGAGDSCSGGKMSLAAKRPTIIFLHGFQATTPYSPGTNGGGNVGYARTMAGLTGGIGVSISAPGMGSNGQVSSGEPMSFLKMSEGFEHKPMLPQYSLFYGYMSATFGAMSMIRHCFDSYDSSCNGVHLSGNGQPLGDGKLVLSGFSAGGITSLLTASVNTWLNNGPVYSGLIGVADLHGLGGWQEILHYQYIWLQGGAAGGVLQYRHSDGQIICPQELNPQCVGDDDVTVDYDGNNDVPGGHNTICRMVACLDPSYYPHFEPVMLIGGAEDGNFPVNALIWTKENMPSLSTYMFLQADTDHFRWFVPATLNIPRYVVMNYRDQSTMQWLDNFQAFFIMSIANALSANPQYPLPFFGDANGTIADAHRVYSQSSNTTAFHVNGRVANPPANVSIQDIQIGASLDAFFQVMPVGWGWYTDPVLQSVVLEANPGPMPSVPPAQVMTCGNDAAKKCFSYDDSGSWAGNATFFAGWGQVNYAYATFPWPYPVATSNEHVDSRTGAPTAVDLTWHLSTQIAAQIDDDASPDATGTTFTPTIRCYSYDLFGVCTWSPDKSGNGFAIDDSEGDAAILGMTLQ